MPPKRKRKGHGWTKRKKRPPPPSVPATAAEDLDGHTTPAATASVPATAREDLDGLTTPAATAGETATPAELDNIASVTTKQQEKQELDSIVADIRHSGTVSDEQVALLWDNSFFPGRFGGSTSVQAALYELTGVHLPIYKLLISLHKIPMFVAHTLNRRRFKRRHYFTRGYGEEVEGDLGYLFPDKTTGFTTFLLVTDITTHNIFVRALPSKHAHEIVAALKSIFEEAGKIPTIMYTDQGKLHTMFSNFAPSQERESLPGTEFLAAETQRYLHANKVIFRTRSGANKGTQQCACMFFHLMCHHLCSGQS